VNNDIHTGESILAGGLLLQRGEKLVGFFYNVMVIGYRLYPEVLPNTFFLDPGTLITI